MRVKMPRLHNKQDEIRRSDARFRVVDCGRRWGKTLMAAVLAFSCALGGGAVWWIGPTSREANIGWKRILPLAAQIPGVTIKHTVRELHFPGGGWIAVLSAENTTLRGEGLDLVIIDEAAFVSNLRRIWQEDLRAALSDKLGRAVFISTPDGRGYFYDLYLRGQSDDWPEWASWRASSYTNPFLSAEEIDAAKSELPEWVFSQEYLAEFVTHAGKVYKAFTPDSDAVFAGSELDLEDYREYWAGIDFGFTNPTAACVGGIDGDDRLDIVAGFYESGLTTPAMVGLVVKLQQEYAARRWFCDNANPDAIAQLRQAGVPAVGVSKATNSTERSSIMAGIVKVETRLVNGRLRICRDTTPAAFINELDRYRYPDVREGAEVKETPLKVDDHFPDALRYLVAGLDDLRGRVPRVRVAA